MSDREQQDTPEQYRLAGEETPTWLALGFTLIGALLAAAAAWLWMTEQSRTARATIPRQPDPGAGHCISGPTGR
ncbi:MAG: hypothetical protein MZV63_19340 [Marinilabiliales bacterium]|nr:hypothetical protein [Marinilabiliales bacterium]